MWGGGDRLVGGLGVEFVATRSGIGPGRSEMEVVRNEEGGAQKGVEDVNCIVHSVKSEVGGALSILDGANSIISRVLSRVNGALSILDGANCIVSRVLSRVVRVLHSVLRGPESGVVGITAGGGQGNWKIRGVR